MNYVMGNLYLFLRDEAKAFRCFIAMSARFEFPKLLDGNLSGLKLFFYQMDRIVGILLPELAANFRREMVNSAYYSSSWFLTLFSNIIEPGPVLMQIWDYFMFEGWKYIFKCGVLILQKLYPHLINKDFTETMTIIKAINTPNCPVDVFDSEFAAQATSIKIKKALLDMLEKEYYALRSKAENGNHPENRISL
jgi:hypothetical protein